MAIKEGSFKGRPIGNMKEQLAARAGLEEKVVGKKYVTMVGGSHSVKVHLIFCYISLEIQ